MAMAATLPRASREQVLAAVSVLEAAGPVTIGRIAAQVAEALDIDVNSLDSMYDLRRVMSWHGLQTEIKHLVASCNLVRRTEEDWRRVSRGLLFPSASSTTWAYCTPRGAQAVREMVLGEQSPMRQELAQQAALRELAARHVQEYRELLAGWLEANPVIRPQGRAE